MPWYWSDDVATALVEAGRIDETTASTMVAAPVAYRSEEVTIESAAVELAEEGEIPLAA